MVDEPTDHTAGGSSDRSPSLTRTTVRGARLALAGWILNQGLLFGTFIVLARLITPRDFGRYAAASVITGVGALFAESGMLSALITRRDRLDEAASTAFYSLLISGSLLTGLSLATAPLVGGFFRSSSVAALAAVLSGCLFLSSLAIVPDALLQRRFSFARRVAADPLGALAFAAASIIAAARGAGAWALVAGAYASLTVQVVSVWAFVRWRPELRNASVAMWRELAAFARPVLGAEVLRRIAAQLDTALLGRFKGAAVLGQYRNGLRLAQQPENGFVQVASYVLLPTFAHLAGDPPRLAAAARRVYGVVAAAALPVSLAALPLGEPVAVLLLGPRWKPAGHAIAALCGITVGGVVSAIAAELFKATGRPRMLVRMHAVGLCSLAVSVGATAAPFGLVGVAVAVSFSTCLTACYGFYHVAPLINLGRLKLAKEFVSPAFASLLMLLAMFSFGAVTHPLSHRFLTAAALTVAQATVGGLVYLAALLAIDRQRRSELEQIVRARRAGGRVAR